MTNLDSILKSRDITFPTRVHPVKAMVFTVVMYGCESWTIKKAERQRMDAFELWCWWRLLRVPWTIRRSNQSILKDISPGCSLDGLLLKLKLQYFGHVMWRTDSFEKTLIMGQVEDRRRRGQQTTRWLDGITDAMDMSLGKVQVGDERWGLACCSPLGRKELDMTEQLNWTELNWGVHLSSTKIPCHPKDCRMARRLRKLRKSKVRQWLSGKESVSQCRRHKRCRFDPWVGTIPWRRKCNPLQYSCLGKSHRQRCLAGYSPGDYKRVEQNLATQQQQQSKTNGSLECPLLFGF